MSCPVSRWYKRCRTAVDGSVPIAEEKGDTICNSYLEISYQASDARTSIQTFLDTLLASVSMGQFQVHVDWM